jgi:hypothetical protein
VAADNEIGARMALDKIAAILGSTADWRVNVTIRSRLLRRFVKDLPRTLRT